MPASSRETVRHHGALPYANGPFHIGHIMEYIQADIWVRFRRLQGDAVHFVCADDTHGAPIMLKAEAEGCDTTGAGRPDRGDAAEASCGAFTSASTTGIRRIRRRTSSCRRTSIDGSRLAASSTGSRSSSSTIRSRRCSWPIATSRARARNAGTKDQYGDACENCSSTYAPTDLIDPYSTLSGVRPELRQSEHLFFQLSAPKIVRVPAALDRATGARPDAAAGSAEQDSRMAGGRRYRRQLADWDISRDPPYFGIPIPDEPGKYFYVWLDAPIGYLASLKAHLRQINVDFAAFLQDREVEQIHFIGKDIVYFHTLFWPAMLKFAGAPYKIPDRVHVHGFITFSARRCRSRAAPGSVRTCTSTSASTPSGCAITSPPS
jgi:methionyl-tRNA synthetase